MKSAANHGDAHCTYYARIPGLMCTIIEHRMTQAPIVPDNILIWCSSTLIPRHQLPPMTHLGTMLHFQLPMPSIITRPPAATAADEGRHPPARQRWPFRVSRTHPRWLGVKSIFDGGAYNLMSDAPRVHGSACVCAVILDVL